MTNVLSTKCSLNYATRYKRERIENTLAEFGRVVNLFIEQFKDNCPKKKELLKAIVNSVDTWLQFSIRQYGKLMERIKLLLNLNRVQFRAISPYKTSQTCYACGHAEYKNRQNQELFRCLNCGHEDNADINAARNILGRLLSGQFSPFAVKSKRGSTEPLAKLNFITYPPCVQSP